MSPFCRIYDDLGSKVNHLVVEKMTWIETVVLLRDDNDLYEVSVEKLCIKLGRKGRGNT